MRVIAGGARGRRLRTLDGEDTRPTIERVKEGLFSAIQFEIEGRRALDLYAGSGQLGIEALSRGAAHCVFVELGRAAAELVRENVRHCKLEERAEVVQGDALGYISRASERPFDLIFADPPYRAAKYAELLDAAHRFDILKRHGIIVLETEGDIMLPGAVGDIRRGRQYRYGRTMITLYRRDGEDGGTR